MNKKLFIISEYVQETQNSTGYYWSKIINKLSINIPDLNVITPYVDIVNENNINYHYFKSVRFSQRSKLKKIISELSQLFGYFKNILFKVNKADLVFSGTNPPLLLVLLAVLKKVKKFEWVILVYDVFPNNFIPAKVLKESSFVYKIALKIFNWSYSSADELIVIGRDMEQLMLDKTQSKTPMRLITNWASNEEVIPDLKIDNPLIVSLGWQDRVVFTFFGNIGLLQGIPNLLEAIKYVTVNNVGFLFIGGGPLVEEVETFIKIHNDLPIKYLGSIPLEQKSIGLNAADISVISLDEGMYGLGVPSKSYFSMAANKKLLVIADYNSEISQVVEEESIGWTCNSGDPISLARLIDEIVNEYPEKEIKSSLRVLNARFSEVICLDKFNETILQRMNNN